MLSILTPNIIFYYYLNSSMIKVQSHMDESEYCIMKNKLRVIYWLLKEGREKGLLLFLGATRSLLELYFSLSSLFLILRGYCS